VGWLQGDDNCDDKDFETEKSHFPFLINGCDGLWCGSIYILYIYLNR